MSDERDGADAAGEGSDSDTGSQTAVVDPSAATDR